MKVNNKKALKVDNIRDHKPAKKDTKNDLAPTAVNMNEEVTPVPSNIPTPSEAKGKSDKNTKNDPVPAAVYMNVEDIPVPYNVPAPSNEIKGKSDKDTKKDLTPTTVDKKKTSLQIKESRRDKIKHWLQQPAPIFSALNRRQFITMIAITVAVFLISIIAIAALGPLAASVIVLVAGMCGSCGLIFAGTNIKRSHAKEIQDEETKSEIDMLKEKLEQLESKVKEQEETKTEPESGENKEEKEADKTEPESGEEKEADKDKEQFKDILNENQDILATFSQLEASTAEETKDQNITSKLTPQQQEQNDGHNL